jgi:hypothetical protein
MKGFVVALSLVTTCTVSSACAIDEWNMLRREVVIRAYNAAKIPSLLLAAPGSAVVFARTRSLVPSVIAHAISNVPMTPFFQGLVVALLLVGAAFTARREAAVVRQVFSDARVVECVALGGVGAVYAIASARVGGFVFVAAAMVVVAIVLEAVDRRPSIGFPEEHMA